MLRQHTRITSACAPQVRELFRSLHRLYVDAASNPFTPLDGKVRVRVLRVPPPPSFSRTRRPSHRLLIVSPAPVLAPAQVSSPMFEREVYATVQAANAVLEYSGPMPF